jgi:hypothetical protein
VSAFLQGPDCFVITDKREYSVVDCSKHASTEMRLQWQRSDIRNCERPFFQQVSCWRDVFPGNLAERAFSDPVFAVWSRRQAVA